MDKGNEFRIWGPPGTGKTTTLKRRIEKAVQEEGMEPESIVCTSFSRAASRELAGRIELPEGNIGTLHSFAFRALGMKKEEVAEGNIEKWNAAYPNYPISSRMSTELAPVNERGKTDGDKLMSLYQYLRARDVPPSEWPGNVAWFGKAWADWKQQEGLADFQDMIEQADPGSMKRGAWLICDEAQDLSPAELKLLRRWGQWFDTLVLAGDPNQAIYHFKGADGEGFINPPLEAKRNHVLGQSWRVPASVQRAAMRWQVVKVNYAPAAHVGDVRDVYASMSDIHLMFENAMAHWRADTQKPERVMLLATAGYMLEGLIKRLKAESVPFWNPYQADNGAWNPLRRQAMDTLMAFERRRINWEVLWALAKDLPATGPYACWHRNRKSLAEKERKEKKADLVAVETAREYLMPQIADGLYSGDFDILRKILSLAGDKQKSLTYTLDAIRRWGLEEVQYPRIVVGSIHSVKGAEADHVFLLPELSPAAFKAWEESPADRRATQRAIYVGMTRAKQSLYLGRVAERGIDWVLDAPRPYADVEEEVIL